VSSAAGSVTGRRHAGSNLISLGCDGGPPLAFPEHPVSKKGDPMNDDPGDHANPPDRQMDFGAMAGITRDMVRLYKEQFGRGPTKTRTFWAGPDTIVTILEDTLTPAERNMVKLHEHQRLRDVRMFFQYATVREFCEPIERWTGRKVRAFTSGIDTEVEGLASELFVLHPDGYEGPSRAERSEL
jgi:uncharacterized protein YbcI